MQPDNQHQEEGLEAPPTLIAALRQLPQPPVFVPPTVNEAVLRAAERHLQKPERARPRWLRWMLPWAATAAAAVVFLSIIIPHFATRPGSNPALTRADFNRDGQVDILDAFALARQLKSGTPAPPQFDVNGDGKVDEKDVATLAARAVSLEKGGRS